MKPMLAHVYEPHRVTYPCYVQPKLNGVRALYQGGYFQSRDGVPFNEKVLAHLAEPLKKNFSPDVILDGELYVHGWPLQRILGAITPVREEPNEDTVKVEYHVFDTVNYQKSFGARNHVRRSMNRHNSPEQQIWSVKTILVEAESQANLMYANFVSLGYEGMMYRLGNCPYTVPKQFNHGEILAPLTATKRTKYLSDKDNRTWHLLKRKDWHDDEFDFISLNSTVGEKGEPGFQMWLRTKEGSKDRFKVSSGLSDKEVEIYLDRPPVGRKVKVKYLVLSQDSIPLNATILAILP